MTSHRKRSLVPTLALVILGLCIPTLSGRTTDNPGVPWPAVDALGRILPTADEVGPVKAGRFVGIFYFLWIGQHGAPDQGPFDVSEIMAEDPQALDKPTSPLWGPEGAFHFWSEPLYGYYRSEDPWVIRRHAQLLSNAGIDVLIFDATNAFTYRKVYETLGRVFTELRAQGERTPQFAFMLNSSAGKTARKLYDDLYAPGLYRDLWFIWQGRPLMLCDPAQADADVKAFFTLRKAHWPFTQVNTPYAWHWEAVYPQVYGYTDDPNAPEQVNVSIAQNLRQSDGKVTPMSQGDARGRSFHNRALDTLPGAVNWGHNAREQWTRALELDPPFVMVTGWNEWVAGRYKDAQRPVMFVDQFDQQCSRDIEMVRGLHQDNYYWQLVANVRRYKGMVAPPAAAVPRTIDRGQAFNQWERVPPVFCDHLLETRARDHRGVGKTHYRNSSGRNDLQVHKVAHDKQHVYFYAQTREPMSPWQDPNWMMLLIDTDQDTDTGWQGYDFVVNRVVKRATHTVLERHVEGWTWQPVAEVGFRAESRQLHLALPREVLGLSTDDGSVHLDFKWIDNWQHCGDVMDMYLSGDTAPEGRFRFRYHGASH